MKNKKKRFLLNWLTFKLEVDVGITVPGFVECIATIQSSIFKAWIFYFQSEHEPFLFPLFALASDSGVIFDYFVFPEPYFIKILDGLTFKLEVDVGITVPKWVECIASIQSSVFKSWILDSKREQEPVLFSLLALPSDSGVLFDDFVFPKPGDLWQRVGLQNALQDEIVPFLLNWWLFWESWRDTIGYLGFFSTRTWLKKDVKWNNSLTKNTLVNPI